MWLTRSGPPAAAAALAGVLAGCASPSPGPELSPRVAAADDWAVFAEDAAVGPLCWIAAPPIVSEAGPPPPGEREGRLPPKRGGVFLYTTFAPGRFDGPQVSYSGGWPLAPQSVVLDVAGGRYDFFAQSGQAWLEDEWRQTTLVADLRTARDAVARSVSADGRLVMDRFSLMGYTTALAEAARLCGAPEPV